MFKCCLSKKIGFGEFSEMALTFTLFPDVVFYTADVRKYKPVKLRLRMKIVFY